MYEKLMRDINQLKDVRNRKQENKKRHEILSDWKVSNAT